MRPEYPESLAEANIAVVRGLIDDVWNAGHAERLPQYWADATRQKAEDLHRFIIGAFPDVRISVEDTVADAHKVATRLTFRGTHQGLFRGIAPTGRIVEFEAIRIYQVDNGKVTDTWATVDVFGLVNQLMDEAAQTDSGRSTSD